MNPKNQQTIFPDRYQLLDVACLDFSIVHQCFQFELNQLRKRWSLVSQNPEKTFNSVMNKCVVSNFRWILSTTEKSSVVWWNNEIFSSKKSLHLFHNNIDRQRKEMSLYLPILIKICTVSFDFPPHGSVHDLLQCVDLILILQDGSIHQCFHSSHLQSRMFQIIRHFWSLQLSSLQIKCKVFSEIISCKHGGQVFSKSKDQFYCLNINWLRIFRSFSFNEYKCGIKCKLLMMDTWCFLRIKVLVLRNLNKTL